ARWGTEVRFAAPSITGEPVTPEAVPADGDLPQALREETDDNENGPADVVGAEEARLARVPAPQDGDPVPTDEALAIPDGAIDIEEPYAAASAEDVTLSDLRSPADIASFSGADAGFDPLLLQAQ